MAKQKSSRKPDRNRPWCKVYRAEMRRERSTVRKLLRRLDGVHGLTDGKAIERLRELAQYAPKGEAQRVDNAIARFGSAEAKVFRTFSMKERRRASVNTFHLGRAA